MGLLDWLKRKRAESVAKKRPRLEKRVEEHKERVTHRKALKEAYKEGKRARLLAKRKREIELARKGVRSSSGVWEGLQKLGGGLAKYSEGVARNIEDDFGRGKRGEKASDPLGIRNPFGSPKKTQKKKKSKKKRPCPGSKIRSRGRGKGKGYGKGKGPIGKPKK